MLRRAPKSDADDDGKATREVLGEPLSEAAKQSLDRPKDYLGGELMRDEDYAVVWELKRPESDESLVESNVAINNIVGCHNNVSLINGRASGESIEEYLLSYMLKVSSLKYTCVHRLILIRPISSTKYSMLRFVFPLTVRVLPWFGFPFQCWYYHASSYSPADCFPAAR
jgi:hypothetical protein